MGTFITHLARQRQAFPCAVDTVKPPCDAADMGSHIIDGEFQSDKYPTCPRGKVPLSVKDPTAQDLLWEYAQRRRAVDAEFSEDLEAALRSHGYDGVDGGVLRVVHDVLLESARLTGEDVNALTIEIGRRLQGRP